MYENDYYTQAWQHPNAPIEGQEYSLNGDQSKESVDNNQLFENETEGGENTNNSIWRNGLGTYVSSM